MRSLRKTPQARHKRLNHLLHYDHKYEPEPAIMVIRWAAKIPVSRCAGHGRHNGTSGAAAPPEARITSTLSNSKSISSRGMGESQRSWGYLPGKAANLGHRPMGGH
jgi:hypothetical protein